MRKRTQNILGFLLLIALIAAPLILLNRAGIDKEQIRLYVEQLGLWAPLGLFLLRFSSVVIPALPGTAYSVLAGGLLGFWQGLVVMCVADLLSCSLSFWLAKRFGRSLIRNLVGDRFMERVERFSRKQLERNFFLMTGFLMSGFFDFVAYGIGLAKAPWRKFFPALVLSIAISNPPVVAFGAGLLARQGRALLVFGGLLGLFGLALLTGWLQRKQGLVAGKVD